MPHETCPGCGSKQIHSLYAIITDHNLKTKHKRRWKQSGVSKCISCDIIIPDGKDVKFWDGNQIVSS